MKWYKAVVPNWKIMEYLELLTEAKVDAHTVNIKVNYNNGAYVDVFYFHPTEILNPFTYL